LTSGYCKVPTLDAEVAGQATEEDRASGGAVRRDSPYWRGSRWAEPRLVAGVAFTTWTADLLPRRPNFEGLREDKPTKDVKLERAHVGDRNRRVRLAWVEAVHA
jgi:ATP-dependent DNA ligase